MVAKKPGAKRSHREMMMSSTTSSVVKGQLVGKRHKNGGANLLTL